LTSPGHRINPPALSSRKNETVSDRATALGGSGLGNTFVGVVGATVLLCPAALVAEGVDWQTAVARLAAERTRAEACVGILKRHGDPAQVSRGELAYGEAKAEVDAVLGALIVALAERKPLGDPVEVEQGLSRGVAARDAFCERAVALLPPTGGEREGILAGLVGGVAGPLVEAVLALYGEAREDDRLRRRTIETQLEATRWASFAEVTP
jgi:hypothetical protein